MLPFAGFLLSPFANFLRSSSLWSFHPFRQLADDLVIRLEGLYLGTDPTLNPTLQRNKPVQGQDDVSASCHLRIRHQRRHG